MPVDGLGEWTITSLAAIVEASDDAIVGLSPEGIVRSWNRGAERLYGFTADEMIGRSREVLLTPDGAHAELRSETLDTFRLRNDGTKFWVSVRVSQILDNTSRVTGYSEIAREIARPMTSEGALAQLAAIVDSSDDAIIGKTIDRGVIQTWNNGAERLYGYAASEVIGQPMSSLLPKALLEEERIILDKVRHGERVHHFSTVRIHKDGRAIHVSLTISPIRNSAGEIIGASHVARDISETKQLKDKLMVSQKMEALGRLAGGVAHDFNNLLTVISGYGALLQAALSGKPESCDMANEVMGAADKAAELTRQLLIFSRHQVIHLQPVDLNDTLSKSLGMLRRLIGEDVIIEQRLAGDLASIQADPGQLSQVMMNLAANARDAMPGGGTITIQTENWIVGDDEYSRELGFTPGRYVRMLFGDTGQGMDGETRSRIFEPFFTTKEIGKGTGLGLATVYGIVKQGGGQISVYSEPGCGTTFALYFPCATGCPEVHKLNDTGETRGSETILLVEDEPGIRKLASSVLQGNGYTVLAAANALEARLQAGSYTGAIHVMVTDIVMPGDNGEELAWHLMEERPQMQVIFMSGYTEHAILERILSEPDAAFLQKPFTPDQLLKKIREVLDCGAIT